MEALTIIPLYVHIYSRSGSYSGVFDLALWISINLFCIIGLLACLFKWLHQRRADLKKYHTSISFYKYLDRGFWGVGFLIILGVNNVAGLLLVVTMLIKNWLVKYF